MAYYHHSQPVRTAFGRPITSRTNSTSGLGILFLFFVLGGMLALRFVAEAATAEASITSDIARAFGGGTPKRVQAGYVPPAEAAPAVDAATQAPAAAPATTEAPAQAAAEPTAAPSPAQTAGQFRVANTDGLGVVLHTAPRRDARIPRGIMEGAKVTVVERVGSEWAHVRSADGQEGWVGAAYLMAAE